MGPVIVIIRSLLFDQQMSDHSTCHPTHDDLDGDHKIRSLPGFVVS